MKKIHLYAIVTLLMFAFSTPIQAQRGMIKRKIKQDMTEKHAEPQKEKESKALQAITYENDTRYPTPENPVIATLALEMKTYKKHGNLAEPTPAKMVFGD